MKQIKFSHKHIKPGFIYWFKNDPTGVKVVLNILDSYGNIIIFDQKLNMQINEKISNIVEGYIKGILEYRY